MPTAKLNAQRLIDLAEKKIAESLVDALVGLPPGPPDMFATDAHFVISRHRERLGLVVAALEASK